MRLVSYMSPGIPAALFEVIGAAIGAEVHFETATSGPPPGQDPFRDGVYDLGWICSTSFVDLALRQDRPSVRLAGIGWVPDDPDVDGRPVYFGDVVVRADAPVTSLHDLGGRRIGCNDAISLSGHLALRFALEAVGARLDDFAELVFTGGHHASIDGVLSGALDACVVDSVVRIGRSRRDPAVAALRVVARLGPWPVQPLVARADLDEQLVARIRATILQATDRAEIGAELAASALVGFVATDPTHYELVAAAFARHRDT